MTIKKSVGRPRNDEKLAALQSLSKQAALLPVALLRAVMLKDASQLRLFGISPTSINPVLQIHAAGLLNWQGYPNDKAS